MALINYSTREINAKIVYYGPGLSGKTTNIHYVFRKVKPDNKGKLISLATQSDRTIFFDFLPVELGMIKGFKTRFHLYTVPGQVFYNSTRKMVLKGSDGIVFVADSQKMMMEENMQSLENLKSNLRDMGLKYDSFPVVFQYNKRDLPNAAPVDEINDYLNPTGLPYFEASAVKGDGVLKTLTAIVKYVLHDLHETPHAHSLDFGAIEKAAAKMAAGGSTLFIDTPDSPAVAPEIRTLAEKQSARGRAATAIPEPAAGLPEAGPLEPADVLARTGEAGLPEEADLEAETVEMTAEDAGGGEEVEMPIASPEFFGAFDNVPYMGEKHDEVFDAEEVVEEAAGTAAEQGAGNSDEPPPTANAEGFKGNNIDELVSMPSYDTFPAPAAETLHEMLEDYPAGQAGGLSGKVETAGDVPVMFDPDMDVDITSGLDMPSLVEFTGEAKGEADETKSGPTPALKEKKPAAPEKPVIRIKKNFKLPVRFTTQSGVREVELNLNVDLGVTGEGLDSVDAVEVLEPRPAQEKPKGTSMHEKDPSKHPPPASPARKPKSGDNTDPIIHMRKKGMFEKMFGM